MAVTRSPRVTTMNLGLVELLIILVLVMGAAATVGVALLVLTGRLQVGDFKTCPYCAERIRRAARICRFCQRELGGDDFGHPPKGLFQ